MEVRSYQQYAIVQGDSARDLTEQLNEMLFRLKGKNPEVEFEGLTARISYSERVAVPENLADEYEMEGVHLTCQDCPFFRPYKKKDGTEDLRRKWGECRFAPYGETARDSSCCKKPFECLNRGEIRLCLAE